MQQQAALGPSRSRDLTSLDATRQYHDLPLALTCIRAHTAWKETHGCRVKASAVMTIVGHRTVSMGDIEADDLGEAEAGASRRTGTAASARLSSTPSRWRRPPSPSPEDGLQTAPTPASG